MTSFLLGLGKFVTAVAGVAATLLVSFLAPGYVITQTGLSFGSPVATALHVVLVAGSLALLGFCFVRAKWRLRVALVALLLVLAVPLLPRHNCGVEDENKAIAGC